MKTNPKLPLTLYIALCLVLLTLPALAYIDPSVTTYLIQAIAGVAVAIAAGVVIYWRKAKKKVADKLGLDEKAKKEVESDNIELMDDKKPEE